MSAKPENRNGFGFLNFFKVGMIARYKRAAQLNSRCQPDSVAKGNNVFSFQSGSFGKNRFVNGINKIDRLFVNIIKNNIINADAWLAQVQGPGGAFPQSFHLKERARL